jgi:dienelactone hydrolase
MARTPPLARAAANRRLTTRKRFVLIMAVGLFAGLPGGILTTPSVRGDEPRPAWETISPYFRPPAEWQGKFGTYRSPLLLNDGTRVASADDWNRRRREILEGWTREMGPWPEVLARPRWMVLEDDEREGLRWRRVRLETAADQFGEGWLLAPAGSGPFPAVLVVYYEPETSVGRALPGRQPGALRDFALQLARRGFVTLSIGTPGGDARSPDLAGAVCQPLSFHAYVSANCWQVLADLPEVDADRIGVTGHSYGGKWALFSAALWDRFAAVAVSDPGIVFDESRGSVNYWEPWYLGLEAQGPQRPPGIPSADNPRTGAYRRLREAGRDLHELHALIAPRPLLVSGGSEDPAARWEALNHLVAVNHLLGAAERVGMTNRPAHGPTEESNEVLYAFFEHFLRAGE